MKTTQKVVKLADYKQPVAGCIHCGSMTFIIHLDPKLIDHPKSLKAMTGIECVGCGHVVPIVHDDD